MFWLSFVECVLVLSVFAWAPVMRGPEGFFGVRVSEEFYANEGRALLRQYHVALFVALILVGALAAFSPAGWIRSVPPLLGLAGALYALFHFRRLVQPHHIVAEKTRTAASLHVRRLSEYTNVAFELVLMALLVTPPLVLLSVYPHLPVRIPVHWNLAMQPDRWVTRSLQAIFLLAFTSLWLQGLLLLVKVSALRTRMPLPVQNTAQYFALKEQSVKMIMRFFDGMRLLLAVLFGVIQLSAVISALPALEPLKPLAAVVIGACGPVAIGSLIYFIVRSRQFNRQLSELAGNSLPAASGDDRGWYGGVLYYNPHDPALFVEKQIGIGFTLNFAHKQALYVMAYVLGGASLLFVWSLTGT